MAIMASIGTGIDDESRIATAPAPQKPSLITAGRITNFHFARICAKNRFKQVPLPPRHPSIKKDHCTVPHLYDRGGCAGERCPETLSLTAGFACFVGNERIEERTQTEPAGRVCAPAAFLPDPCLPA